MATRQRSRSARESAIPSVNEAVLGANPEAIVEGEASSPPIEAKFVGERVPARDRHAQIAEAAYLRAERRGFMPGLEIEDWLEAERELEALLSARESGR